VGASALLYSAYSHVVGTLPDGLAIPLHFRLRAGYWPNLRQPSTFNEKIQHRKLHGDRKAFARYADKLAVKAHVSHVLGDSFVTPTLWHGAHLPPASERKWPLPVVIKSNHGTGRNYFARTQTDLEDPKFDALCARWMTARSHPHLKERFYELIDRQLLVEPFLGEDLNDYKFYVFAGRVGCIHVDTDRRTAHKRNFYDLAWKRLPFALRYPPDPLNIERPPHLDMMIEAAEKLGAGFDFVRVDLYDLPDGPVFGEMTFTPGGGYERFSPREWDGKLGGYWPIGTE
jgi:hypothetical protein